MMAKYGEAVRICDNSSSNGPGVIGQQCWKAAATRIVKITYNKVESDTLRLCKACADAVTKDARRHGYTVTNRKMGRS